MRQRAWILIAILGTAAALTAGGCNDDDGDPERPESPRAGSGDVREIRNVVRRFILSQSPRLECRVLTTRDLIQRIFGDVPQCLRAARPDKDDKPSKDVRIPDVRVEPGSATARIRLVGGDADGSTGTLELRKERGRWLVDDFGVDLLRSLLVKGVESEAKEDETLRRPAVRRCVLKAFDDLSDDELKRVAYASISKREGSEDEVVELMLPCLRQPGRDGRTVLRDQFEEGIAKSAREDDVPRATIDCILRRLRRSVTDRQLARLATRGEESTEEIRRAVARAVLGCRSEAPPATSS